MTPELEDKFRQDDLPEIQLPTNHMAGDLSQMDPSQISVPSSWREALEYVIDRMCEASTSFSRERFDDGQRELVLKILAAYASGVKDVIVEAPTGTGKSIIGMVIAEVLRKIEKSTTYVLTSNKFLQNQMETDSNRFKLDWVLLKGQANYECHINGRNFLERECAKLTLSKAEQQMDCAPACGYLVTRRRAAEADGAILSYAYWLTAMNFVYAMLQGNALFQPRNFTIFDECHKVSDQVQSMFTVEISDQMVNMFKSVLYFVESDERDHEKLAAYKHQIDNIEGVVNVTFERFETLSNAQFVTCVDRIRAVTQDMCILVQTHISRYVPEKSTDINHSRLEKLLEKLQSLTSLAYMYVNTNRGREDNVIRHIEERTIEGRKLKYIILRTLDEASLMERYVHGFTDRSMYMSGTIGNIEAFARLNGIKEFAYISIDSNFNWDKSPIYKVKPSISLSNREKANSMPTLLTRIKFLVEKVHAGQKGIIHTGNYEIMRNLHKEVGRDPRYLFYNNSHEKELMLEKHAKSEDTVICGPSLVEGISLDDDLSRFQIHAKVPYPSLADILNSEKLKRIDGWYDYKTLQEVIQSFGRSIRHKDDYATIYLMDLCFEYVFNKNKIPHYIRSRIGTYDISAAMDSANRVELDFL